MFWLITFVGAQCEPAEGLAHAVDAVPQVRVAGPYARRHNRVEDTPLQRTKVAPCKTWIVGKTLSRGRIANAHRRPLALDHVEHHRCLGGVRNEYLCSGHH